MDVRVGLWRKLSPKELMLLTCETLESPLDYKEIQPSILMETCPGYSLEGLIPRLKLQYLGHLMRRADSLEKTLLLGKTEGRRRGRQRMRWLDSITNSIDMSLSQLREMVKDRKSWHAAVHRVTKNQTWSSIATEWQSAPVLKLLREVATRGQHFFMPHLAARANSPREKFSLGCGWVERSRSCVSLLLRPLSSSRDISKTLRKVWFGGCLVLRWGDSRERGCWWETTLMRLKD